MNKIARLFFDKEYRFYTLDKHKFYYFVPDKIYLKKKFKIIFKRDLDLNDPKTYNEKVQWLKLYNRNPFYTTLVDKHEVKKYISDVLGDEYVIPTLGIWDRFDDIDFDSLPERFALKCTHDSGSYVICKSKKDLDIPAAKKKIERSMKNNWYKVTREWPYKNVKPKIVAEKYVSISNNDDLTDYKLLCFNGEVKCEFTCTNRRSSSGLNVTFFDTNWERLPFERHYASDKQPISKPTKLSEMIHITENIAKDLQCIFVRMDFYEINSRIYFGEVTLYPGSGMEEFRPEEWDLTLGNWIHLPSEKND